MSSSILPLVSLADAIDLTVMLASVGLLVQSCEDLWWRASFSNSLLTWRIDRSAYREPSLVQRALDVIFSERAFGVVLVVRLAAPASVLGSFVMCETVPGWLIGILLVVTGLFGLRSRHGLDGSHHMFLVVLLPCAVARLQDGNVVVAQMCLAYIAGQLCLSYVIAGAAKLIGESWRSGAAIVGILSTDAFGHRTLCCVVERVPGLRRAICWSVVLFELSFPVVFFVSEVAQAGILGVALGFHVLLGAFMGLNKFVWAWGAAFPSLLWALSAT